MPPRAKSAAPAKGKGKDTGDGDYKGGRGGRATAGKSKKDEDDEGPANDHGENRDALECFGEERKHIERWTKKARMGYFAMDVMNPPEGTVWGQFNDRNVNEGQVTLLVEKFKTNVDNCTGTTAMRVAVKSAWVSNLSAALGDLMGMTIDQVPMLEFTPEALDEIADDEEKNDLWMLSGNHRRLALEKHLRVGEKMLESRRDALEAVEKRIHDDGFIKEVEDQKILLVKEIEQREQSMMMGSRWAVEVYNRDVIDAFEEDKRLAIYQWLSENDDKAVHKKTDEEGLQQLFNYLKVALERDIEKRQAKEEAMKLLEIQKANAPAPAPASASGSDKDKEMNEDDEDDDDQEELPELRVKYPEYWGRLEKLKTKFKGVNAGYRRLMCMSTFVFGLVQASRVRRHYLHAPWFRVSHFNKMVVVHGGLLSEFLSESVETLERLASDKEPPLNYGQIRKKIERFNSTHDEKKLAPLRSSVAAMEAAYVSGRGNLKLWKCELLDEIDRIFVEHFMKGGEPVDYLFTPHDINYLRRYESYQKDVEEALLNPEFKAPRYARTYFLYSTLWKMRGVSYPMPIGTKSVFECLNKIATLRRKGIEEVISWTATLVSWSPKIGGKVFLNRDQFDAMADSVGTDPLINEMSPGITRFLYHFFMDHMKTNITSIASYLNDHETPREADFKFVEYKKFAEEWRDIRDDKSKKNPFTRMSNKSTPQAGPSKLPVVDTTAPERQRTEAAEEALRYLKKLGSNFNTFGQAVADVLANMTSDPHTYKSRSDTRSHVRHMCAGGLSWNKDSKSRFRDYIHAAISAVFESMFVPLYRPQLFERCGGAWELRDELTKYLFSIAKSNTVMPMQKPGEQRSLRKPVAETAWFYADLMKPPSVIPKLEYLKPEEWQKKLEKSERTFTARKSNDIVKNITTVRNSQYLQCTEKDVEVGTMETAAFKLLNSLYRLMQVKKAYLEHINNNEPGDFVPEDVEFEELIARPHATTKVLQAYIDKYIMTKPGGGSADDEDEDDEDEDEDDDTPIQVPTPRRAQTKRKLSTASPNRFDSLAKSNPPPPSKNDAQADIKGKKRRRVTIESEQEEEIARRVARKNPSAAAATMAAVPMVVDDDEDREQDVVEVEDVSTGKEQAADADEDADGEDEPTSTAQSSGSLFKPGAVESSSFVPSQDDDSMHVDDNVDESFASTADEAWTKSILDKAESLAKAKKARLEAQRVAQLEQAAAEREAAAARAREVAIAIAAAKKDVADKEAAAAAAAAAAPAKSLKQKGRTPKPSQPQPASSQSQDIASLAPTQTQPSSKRASSDRPGRAAEKRALSDSLGTDDADTRPSKRVSPSPSGERGDREDTEPRASRPPQSQHQRSSRRGTTRDSTAPPAPPAPPPAASQAGPAASEEQLKTRPQSKASRIA